jgi:hypothetical protein
MLTDRGFQQRELTDAALRDSADGSTFVAVEGVANWVQLWFTSDSTDDRVGDR